MWTFKKKETQEHSWKYRMWDDKKDEIAKLTDAGYLVRKNIIVQECKCGARRRHLPAYQPGQIYDVDEKE